MLDIENIILNWKQWHEHEAIANIKIQRFERGSPWLSFDSETGFLDIHLTDPDESNYEIRFTLNKKGKVKSITCPWSGEDYIAEDKSYDKLAIDKVLRVIKDYKIRKGMDVLELIPFCRRLKALRKSKGWSQEALANQAIMTKAAISAYEKNKRQPKLRALFRLAYTLNTSMDYLAGLSNSRHRVLHDFEWTGIKEAFKKLGEKDRDLILEQLRELNENKEGE